MCQTHAARARCLLPPLLWASWHRGLGRCGSVGEVPAALGVLVNKRRVSLWMARSREGMQGVCGSLSPASFSTSFGCVPPL